MEKIKLIRNDVTDERTFGEIWYNDKFICYTLEDPIRDVKIKHKTAVPFGTYQIIINLSPRFKQLMPRLLNVPNYSGVLIHKGNTVEDSSGCILVGEIKHGNKLLHSSVAYTELFLLLKQLLKKGEVFIEITKPEIIPVKTEIVETKVVETTTIIEPVLQVEENLTNQKKSLLWKSYFPNLFKLILNLLKHLLSPKSATQQ